MKICEVCKKEYKPKLKDYRSERYFKKCCSQHCYIISCHCGFYNEKGELELTERGKEKIKCTQDTQNIKKTENYLIEF